MWSNAEAAEDQTASSRFSIFRLVAVDTSRLSQRRFCFSNLLYEVQVWDKQEVRIRARGIYAAGRPLRLQITPSAMEQRGANGRFTAPAGPGSTRRDSAAVIWTL